MQHYSCKAQDMVTVHLLISGKVQGVYFRVSAKEKADELVLTGWVRNTESGAVEAEASGPAERVKAFIDWCHRGPEDARVISVAVSSMPPKEFENFAVHR